ncbi:histidinol dehydrogenase [Gammaproteobacteria bacterium]|nr:histidinol dehydrogenase [Gammaproteobacteria bacterium]MDA9039394.1 histidinol dehydrogenase [Gammaproteobacteria bacterium]
MRIINYQQGFSLKTSIQELSEKDRLKLLEYESLIKEEGDLGIKKVNKSINVFTPDILKVSKLEFEESSNLIEEDLKAAILVAKSNIENYSKRQFKSLQLPAKDTTSGISLWSESRPIDKVGLYVPGGSAPLLSSLLMQAIPAIVAGCKNIYVCTPSNNDGKVDPAILWIAYILNIENIYKVGGSQAIFALANGTESVTKVDKIFGPGNLYVTEAKRIVSSYVSIDMPAGPSEVFIISNDEKNVKIIAADLLSQLEHGIDSRAVLLSLNKNLLNMVKSEVKIQLKNLSRQEILQQSIQNLILVNFEDLNDLIDFTNNNAPEHLIIPDDNLLSILSSINNAGSIFLGALSPESFGDYASGSNHTLPTNGYAKTYSGLSVKDFTKSITIQRATKSGFNELSKHVIALAEAEGLDAHSNAVKVRQVLLDDDKPNRSSFVSRFTNETKIYTNINIDGTGSYSINTGIKFFDHMLEQFSKHGKFDFMIEAIGDIEIDEHHTIEDVAITLGEAFKKALTNRNNIRRYSSSETLVMDEAKSVVSIDMASRPNIIFEVPKMEPYVGDFPTEMFEHFFISFVNTLGFNCHITTTGKNSHHIIESTFKSFARCLSDSLLLDGVLNNSTKGHI